MFIVFFLTPWHTEYQNWIQNEVRNMVVIIEYEHELIGVIQRLVQNIN